jgi:hypothetical protein
VGGAAGGMGGWASGHRGVVVELEDTAAAPDEDPRQPEKLFGGGKTRWRSRVHLGLLQPAERKK